MSLVDPVQPAAENVVDRLLLDLEDAAEHWEARVADEESERFEVSLPDIEAVADRLGRLLSLWIDDSVFTLPVVEFEARLNQVIGLLRQQVLDAFNNRPIL